MQLLKKKGHRVIMGEFKQPPFLSSQAIFSGIFSERPRLTSRTKKPDFFWWAVEPQCVGRCRVIYEWSFERFRCSLRSFEPHDLVKSSRAQTTVISVDYLHGFGNWLNKALLCLFLTSELRGAEKSGNSCLVKQFSCFDHGRQ